MNKIDNYRTYALDQLREYLVIEDVEVDSKEDFVRIYSDMLKKGYFYKADVADKLDEVEKAFKDFAKVYEKDSDILEKDLIFFGAKRVLEKMEGNKIKR